MNRVRQILQSKYATAFCLIIAIVNRIVFTTLYSTIGRDTKVQLTYAENLLAGKGMGVTKYFTTNLNDPVFDTYWFFPPGFSLSIIPFIKLFNGQEYSVVLAFDISAAILFIIAVRVLGKKAGLPASINNIVTVIAGCSQYPFFMSSSSTDAISLSFALFAVAGLIEIVNRKNQLTLFQVVIYGFLFFLPGFFRYMYLPISVLLPLFILVAGIFSKNRQLRIAGSKLMAVSILFLVLLFTFTASYSGNAVHIYNSGRGVFFDQVIRWYPFLPASFINLDFAAQQVEKVLGVGYSRVLFYLEIINAIFFLFLFILLTRYLISYKKRIFLLQHSVFIITGSIISIMIIIMLAYLSLTYKAQDWGAYKWTYSYDIRYFAFIYILIPILFVTVLYYYPVYFKRFLPRCFVLVAIFCFIIEILHGVYYNAKILMNHNSLSVIRDRDKDYRSFPLVVRDIKNKYPDREILVCAPDQFYLHTASQMGYKAIFDYKNLNQTELVPGVKSILLVPVHQQDAWIMKEYIEKKKPTIIATIAGTNFYMEELISQ